MSLDTTISLRASLLEALSQDLGAKQSKIDKQSVLHLLDGTGLGQASKVWWDTVSQIQSVNNDLDLVGALVGAFGTVAFTAIKGILVFADAANPASLVVGNVTNGIVAPFGAATHSQAVAPGGFYGNINPTAAGFALVGGTADLLRIASPATVGTYNYDVIVFGI